MLSSIATILIASTTAASAGALPKRGLSAYVTGHDSYSSSIGIVGAKINTNRVAYWPTEPDCDKFCLKVSHEGRSLHLLHIDHSGEAHDISYDAWNYLTFGKYAKEEPHYGGGTTMDYEYVPAEECKDLLHNGKLPFIAGSPNQVFVCKKPENLNSYTAKNYELFNLNTQSSNTGWDEECILEPGANQAKCPHPPDLNRPSGLKVVNIAAGTGKEFLAV
jgi:hypothetical protein